METLNKNITKATNTGAFSQAKAWGVEATKRGEESAVAKFYFGAWLIKAKELQKEMTGSSYGFATEIYEAVASKTGRPLNSVQSSGSQAMAFANQYENEQAVRDWFMVDESKKASKKGGTKGRRTERVRKLEKAVADLTDAEWAALVQARKDAKSAK
jgi:hypothetical protein